MEFTIASRTDVGRVRTNNEDNFLVDEGAGLFVVCDGMGGHNAGEVASKLACEWISKEIATTAKLRRTFESSGDPADLKALQQAMESALTNACREIYRQAQRNPEQQGMGTTCSAVLLVGHNKGILAHVGDSRLYVVRGGTTHQLTEDHTYVNELVKRGALSREQAKNHPQGNVLSRAMGVQPNISVDTMIFDLDPGDTYVLCSDGVYNYYPDAAEIAMTFRSGDLQPALKQLIDGALQRGGHDNCTAVAIRIGGKQPVSEATLAEKRIATLKRIPIFAHLTYHELVRVLGLTRLLEAQQGKDIIVEGTKGDELYVILSGEVDVLKGGTPITVLKAGVHLGEMALIDNAPRSATIRARSHVHLLAMRREEFFGLIRSEPVVASKLLWSFVKVLSGRLREANEALQGARSKQGSPAAASDDDDDFEIFLEDD
jgi:serine/threonine protein phosphatase PrpC